MSELFGTDGVRGLANVELTPRLAFDLGRAAALVFKGEGKEKPVILVGMDTRISGTMLKSALVSGICAAGANALVAGIVPTPAVAFLVGKYKANGGIVISASHNPYEFNGIKIFDDRGCKLSDELENKIEDIILGKGEAKGNIQGRDVGTESLLPHGKEDYIRHLCDLFNGTLEGYSIALDCANGAAYEIAPMTFQRLGAKVYPFEVNPDGTNINFACGSTHMENISDKTLKTGAMLGIAFDGDADRALFCDEKGSVVNGDKILAIFGKHMKQKGTLMKNTIVSTVMANMGLDEALADNGIDLVKTKVGDRYVLEEMLSGGYNLGGEQSGHIILSDVSVTGDGMVTALKLLEVLKDRKVRMSRLASSMEVYPQVLANAKVANSKKYDYVKDEVIGDMIRKAEIEYGKKGRILIRPSGTEPLVRVMIEGKDLEDIRAKAEKMASLIEERMG